MMALCSKRMGLLLLLLSLLIYQNLLSQIDLHIDNISTESGLSQGYVYDIIQDLEGFIWIGTKDGLNRFDGNHFEVFTNDPNNPYSISGNSIVKLFEDSKGRIWACNNTAGISIFDKKSGRFHHILNTNKEGEDLFGNYVSSIVEDSSGYFVVGIAEHEINLFQLDDTFFEQQKPLDISKIKLPPYDSTTNNTKTLLRGIAKDNLGRIWVGTQNNIYRLNVKQKRLIDSKAGFSFGTALSNSDGSIWTAGAHQPLTYWDGTQAVTYSKRVKAALDLFYDNHGRMWFVGADSLFGLDINKMKPGLEDKSFDASCFFKWQPKSPSIGAPFRSLFVDRSGIVWTGTLGYGIFKINPNITHFSHHLPGISIRQFDLLPDDQLFINEYFGVWYDRNGKKLGMDPLQHYGEEQRCDNFLVSKSGEYWSKHEFGSKSDIILRRYNPVTKASQVYKLDEHQGDLQPLIESRDGSIWMAGLNDCLTHLNPDNGAMKSYFIEGEKIQPFSNNRNSLRKENATALFEDYSEFLWMGTERGLSKIERNPNSENLPKLTSYYNVAGDPKSLSNNHITGFLDDPKEPDRYIWISTKGGGINRLDKTNDEFLQLTTKEGLPNNVVYGLVADNEGNIWGSTNKGLFCLLKQKDTIESETDNAFIFRNFTRKDGLQHNEFNTGAYAKLPDGKLLFGGINGYNLFDPKEILSVKYSPQTHITGLLINNSKVLPNDETGILNSRIETTKQITLNRLQNIATIEFASLDFRAPEQIKYRYQLKGGSETWIEVGNQRSATLVNLPPGTYAFRVQGSNSQGIWSNHFAELNIKVLPPWWKTWWAYAIYLCLIIAAIWSYFQFSINREKLRQQLEFEKLEAERIRELDTIKSQLYINMTHEFRTPLTIILGMAHQVMENPKEHFNSGMNMILRNGKNLLSLVNKMLNLSKLESGKMTLELAHGDVVYFLRNIVESFRSFSSNKNIQLHFLPEVDALMMDFDADKLQQVVSNLISNAYKFTPERGNIYFSIRKEDSNFLIRVKDTGRGIPENDLPNVFDRFFQADNSSTRQYEGTGIGLALTKELVNLMQGEITVQSPPIGSKSGAEFFVQLPILHEAVDKPLQFDEMIFEKKASTQNEESSHEKPEKIIENAAAEKQLDTLILKEIEDIKKAQILLVEDNPDVVAYVASCLPDYRLAVAENGQEGFEIAAEMIPDLIISDVMMPIMNGFELCEKLKSDKRTDHIPIIILTARVDIESKLEGLEFGANAYLPKPYDKQELLLTIKNLFQLRNSLQQRYHLATSEEAVIESEISKPENQFVIEVRELISAHMDDQSFNVEKLAKALFLSHSQFGRKLDALTGFTPNQFIRIIRLNKAKELLSDEDLSISGIAYSCGFKDPSYFSRVFKKEFGKTPAQWREHLT